MYVFESSISNTSFEQFEHIDDSMKKRDEPVSHMAVSY